MRPTRLYVVLALLGAMLLAGWLSLTLAQTPVLLELDPVRNVSGLNVRAEPNSQAAIVGVIRPGEQVPQIGQVPYWYQVRLPNNVEGWAAKAWLRTVQATVPPPADVAALEAKVRTLTAERDVLLEKVRELEAQLASRIPTERATLPVGQGMVFMWVNTKTATPKDWIGLYPQGAPDAKVFVWWVYAATCKQTADVARKEGACILDPPPVPPGIYELRLYANDGYMRLATSEPITVLPREPIAVTPPAATLWVRKATGTLTHDGSLAEPDWAMTYAALFKSPTKTDNAVVVRALWTPTHLWVAYDVTDDAVEGVGTGCICGDDGMEWYLDVGNERPTTMGANDFHLLADITGRIKLIKGSGSGSVDVAGAAVKSQRRAGGYTMEVTVLWSALSVTPAAGMTFGIMLANNDRDDNGAFRLQWDWQESHLNGHWAWHNPSKFGTLVLE